MHYFSKMKSGKNNQKGEFLGKHEQLIMQCAEGFAIPEGSPKSEVWSLIENKIKESQERKTRLFGNSIRISYGIAASVIFLIGFFYVLSQFAYTKVQTSPGEQIVFYLPDSSKVTLNAASKISFNSRNWEKERIVELDGEAFFEVKTGKAFQVFSENGVVEVLGTSFNVFARNDQYIVDCMTGKVKVSNKELNNFRILTPGLSSIIQNNQVLYVTKNSANEIGGWLDGEFVYEKSLLTDVIEEMERQFDIVIKYDFPIDKRVYTGYFDNENLEESLEKVFQPMGIKYKIINDKEIVISEK